MRIVQVVHGLPPQERAGTEILTLELSRALQARGHQVTIVARTFAPECEEFSLQEELDEHGLRIIRIVNNYTRTTSFRLHYNNPFFHAPFRQLLRRCQADIVHFQHVAHLSASLIPSVSSLGHPTVLSLHDFFFACHLVQLIDRADRLCPGPQQGERCVTCLRGVASAEDARHRFTFMAQVLRVPQRVITPSAFLARRMADEFPFLHNRLQVIAPGLPLPPGSTQDRRTHKMDAVPDISVPSRSPRRPLRIVYVGVLLPHKGAHVLVDALKGIPADRIHASFYGAEVAAKRAYPERLRQAAAGLSVHWGGVYERSTLQIILAEHDVLVLPVIWEETFSLVTREALQAGLPVIAARRGALPEAIEDGRNGLLFEPENAEDLRRCLRRLLDEPGLLARLKPDQFAWRDAAVYAREVEQAYEGVLMPSGSRPALPQSTERPSPSDQASGASGLVAQPRLLRDTPLDSVRPLLSVCLPTYNGAAFIEETLRSILNQSYQDFELVVVDDGSTDNTLEIVQSFSDPRIQLHRNPKRLGIPANWNRCLDLAHGEFVCVFHQDDVMLPENLARKIQLLSADETVGFVHSAVETLAEESAPTSFANWIEDATEDTVWEGLEYFRTLLLNGNRVCAPTVLARRHHLLEQGGFDQDFGFACDYAMWLRLCMTYRVGFLVRPLVGYRWHGGNASHAYQFERGEEEILEAGRHGLRLYHDRGPRSDGPVLDEAFKALTKLRRWNAALQRGKAWLEGQRESWQSVAETQTDLIHELKGWIEELETGKAWLEGQRAAQQTWIEELETGKAWLEGQRAAQQTWIEELETGKAWLEGQRAAQQTWIEELETGKAWLEGQRAAQQTWIEELETGKAWLEGQRESWQSVAETQNTLIHELKGWIEKLETGNAWLEEQRESWQSVAETQNTLIHHELKGWIEKLETGNAWLEEQRESWQSVAETQTDLIHELKGWIEELETGKAWLEGQRAAQQTWLEGQRDNWERIAQHWQAQTRQWQESSWARLGVRLKLVNPVQEFPAKTEPAKVEHDD